MSVLVVGSIALDTLETPFGTAESVLGGSAVYFSLAASFFAPVRLVSVVGNDFPEEYTELLRRRSIGLDGLEVTDGKTFRWDGAYEGDMNEALTREVQLNCFGDFLPTVPPQYADSRFVFLANSSPHTQLHVREQLPDADFVLADTMNLWIETEKPALMDLLGRLDGLILNDDEARQLTGCHNLLRAGRWILERGPQYCFIKKAEHGAMLLGPDGVFVLPGYPTDEVRDPTGAGDSFAGGLVGFAASHPQVQEQILRNALAYGTIVASYTIEDFGTARLDQISREDLEERLQDYVAMTHLP
jgi:sugar/nucleoside kinase (ribokinase family)